jgi:hypothetical protein
VTSSSNFQTFCLNAFDPNDLDSSIFQLLGAFTKHKVIGLSHTYEAPTDFGSDKSICTGG